MQGINKVILVGNCGKEPELYSLQDGVQVAKITLATTQTFRLKNGESQSRTDWHTIILWRGLASLASKYIRKGSLLYIEGSLQNRQYSDKDGQKKFVTEVVAEKVLLLDKKIKPSESENEVIAGEDLPF